MENKCIFWLLQRSTGRGVETLKFQACSNKKMLILKNDQFADCPFSVSALNISLQCREAFLEYGIFSIR